MPLLCLTFALQSVALGNEATLRWQHSVEKIVWEEDYIASLPDAASARALKTSSKAVPEMLLIEARVRGSGAGMEIPQNATLRDGSWHYRPSLRPLAEVMLTHSPYTTPYKICTTEKGQVQRCKTLPEWMPTLPEQAVVRLSPCVK